MKVIALPRGTGKTTRLIILSADSGGYIVCRSQDECSRIFAEAREMNLRINFPMTYEEFISRSYGMISEFYIDDIEAFLRSLSPRVPVTAFTVDSNSIEEPTIYKKIQQPICERCGNPMEAQKYKGKTTWWWCPTCADEEDSEPPRA